MGQIIEAPNSYTEALQNSDLYSIFLAGSIENGKAVDWQDTLSQTLAKFENVVVLNPRRKQWNPDIGGQELRRQIIWEQIALKRVNLKVFYFDPKTHSPISLLELGQVLGFQNRVVVYCPPSFFRFTNVEVTCAQYGVNVHSDYNTFVSEIISKISKYAY